MAHLEHHKSFNGDTKRIFNEAFREFTDNEKYAHIDTSRSSNNYVLMHTSNGVKEFSMCKAGRDSAFYLFEKRVEELQAGGGHITKTGKIRKIRSDANTLSVWAITCPVELFENVPREEWGTNPIIHAFFVECYEFLVERYGKKNVMPSPVHNDETSPHLHCFIVPAKDEKLSVKGLFDRKELSRFHDDLDAVITKEFGQKGLIKNGRTKGNYTVAELRERTRQENAMLAREIRYNEHLNHFHAWKEQETTNLDKEVSEFRAKRKKHEETMANETQKATKERETLSKQLDSVSLLHYDLATMIGRAVDLLEEIEDVKKREQFAKELQEMRRFEQRFADNVESVEDLDKDDSALEMNV